MIKCGFGTISKMSAFVCIIKYFEWFMQLIYYNNLLYTNNHWGV